MGLMCYIQRFSLDHQPNRRTRTKIQRATCIAISLLKVSLDLVSSFSCSWILSSFSRANFAKDAEWRESLTWDITSCCKLARRASSACKCRTTSFIDGSLDALIPNVSHFSKSNPKIRFTTHSSVAVQSNSEMQMETLSTAFSGFATSSIIILRPISVDPLYLIELRRILTDQTRTGGD